MIRVAVKVSRAATSAARSASLGQTSSRPCGPSLLSPPPFRSLHDANPVALQMINYALSHARSQKSGSSPNHLSMKTANNLSFEFLKLWYGFVFVQLLRWIVRARPSGTGAVPFHSAKWGPRLWEFKGISLAGHVDIILWKVLFFFLSLIYIVGAWLVVAETYDKFEFDGFQREFWWSSWETSENRRFKALFFGC